MGDTVNACLQRLYGIDRRRTEDARTADHVAVAVQILGGRVHDDVCAKSDRGLQMGRQERVVRHQHRIRHPDDNQVLQPQSDNDLSLCLGPQKRVVAVKRRGRPVQRHAARIRPGAPPDCFPVSQIRPAGTKGHHGQVI